MMGQIAARRLSTARRSHWATSVLLAHLAPAAELSVRIHEFGGGVSQLIGTGGRDLSEKIGGLMMLDAISMLENDPQTEIIVLISNRLRLRWPAKCWNAHAPAASQWWPASSVVAKRQWMSRGYSCSRQQRGGIESGDALRRETRTSRSAYA